ncbi:unnamed protein product [Didymodactylos carnosus]|nr:unnamed protein product [Didymodactylos carnosus]CAF4316751.1 unnamed protein product [Didymodactylos carnosus]
MEHSYFAIDLLLWKILSLLLPIFGIPGNVLIIIIMLNKFNRKHPISLYFATIALFEIIYLTGVFWDWLDVMSIVQDPRKTLNCSGFYVLVLGSAIISFILLANINIDRVGMILLPSKITTWITHRKVTLTIIITIASTYCTMIHYHFSLYYHSGSSVLYGQACVVKPNARIWFEEIWPILYLTIFRVLPSFIVLICSTIILCNRCSKFTTTRTTIERSLKVTGYFSRQSVRMQTLSLILVFFSFYFIISIMPITILQFYNKYLRYETSCIKRGRWKLMNTLFIMFESTNYTNKFYVKLLVSKQFRKDVKTFILMPLYRMNIIEGNIHLYSKRRDRNFKR